MDPIPSIIKVSGSKTNIIFLIMVYGMNPYK